MNGDDGATPFCAKCPSGEEATEMGSAGYLDDIDVVFIVGVDEPMHPEWVRRVVDQCRAAGVPCVLVTWGDYIPADQATEDDVGEMTSFTLRAIAVGEVFSRPISLWRHARRRSGRGLAGVAGGEHG